MTSHEGITPLSHCSTHTHNLQGHANEKDAYIPHSLHIILYMIKGIIRNI